MRDEPLERKGFWGWGIGVWGRRNWEIGNGNWEIVKNWYSANFTKLITHSYQVAAKLANK